MRKLLSYGYITVLGFLLLWLVVTHPPRLLVALLLVGFLGAVIGVGLICIWLHDAWKTFRYDRQLQTLLGDMTLKEVLERSPYDYGHVFQGDDGYRVWPKEQPFEFVQVNISKEAAELWIVEQYAKSSPNGED